MDVNPADRTTAGEHNNSKHTVRYTFDYDGLGRKTQVRVDNPQNEAAGSYVLSTNTYKADRSGLLDKVTFGNNGQVEYTYDDYDRLSGVKYDGESGQRYTYQYGANGRVAFVHDNHLNRTLQSEYDLAERPV